MKIVRLVMLAIIAAGVAFPPTAHAQGPISSVNQDARFEQRPGVQVPPDLVFRDETGSPVRLGDYFGTKPVILTLNYYHCSNMCSLALDTLTQQLADLQLNLGDEYAVVTVSIDPRETPDLAAQKKWIYVRDYGRPNRGAGWHFMTGDESSIEQLAQAVGFHYAYDAATDEYAHPIGLVVLTPEGKIARYLYGVDYDARDLELALAEASQGTIGSVVDRLMLVCYHYDPANGAYSSTILSIVRWAGVATVAGLGLVLGLLWRADLKRDGRIATKPRENSKV